MNNRTEAKLTDLSGMQKAIEEILKQAWERGRKYGQNEDRPQGEWIECEDNTSFVKQLPRMWLECSCCTWSCDRGYKTRYKFCPNCGAKMRGEEE